VAIWAVGEQDERALVTTREGGEAGLPGAAAWGAEAGEIDDDEAVSASDEDQLGGPEKIVSAALARDVEDEEGCEIDACRGQIRRKEAAAARLDPYGGVAGALGAADEADGGADLGAGAAAGELDKAPRRGQLSERMGGLSCTGRKREVLHASARILNTYSASRFLCDLNYVNFINAHGEAHSRAAWAIVLFVQAARVGGRGIAMV
jgi:hypothetical protein